MRTPLSRRFESGGQALPEASTLRNLTLKFAANEKLSAGGLILVGQFLQDSAKFGNPFPARTAIPTGGRFTRDLRHVSILTRNGRR